MVVILVVVVVVVVAVFVVVTWSYMVRYWSSEAVIAMMMMVVLTRHGEYSTATGYDIRYKWILAINTTQRITMSNRRNKIHVQDNSSDDSRHQRKDKTALVQRELVMLPMHQEMELEESPTCAQNLSRTGTTNKKLSL